MFTVSRVPIGIYQGASYFYKNILRNVSAELHELTLETIFHTFHTEVLHFLLQLTANFIA